VSVPARRSGTILNEAASGPPAIDHVTGLLAFSRCAKLTFAPEVTDASDVIVGGVASRLDHGGRRCPILPALLQNRLGMMSDCHTRDAEDAVIRFSNKDVVLGSLSEMTPPE